MACFIDEQEIFYLLKIGENASLQKCWEIYQKASLAKGLTPLEVAILLKSKDKNLWANLAKLAGKIKEEIYGKRIVFFAPLYISNYCQNYCLYCAYQKNNQEMVRKCLSMEEIIKEVRVLEKMGHKRLALECGEDYQKCSVDYILKAIYSIYQNSSIRRLNVNIAATTVENYRLLKEAQIGTYILFQETYHFETYQKMHPKGFKKDYHYHLYAMHRAMEGGIEDVGLGVLYGLYDYAFETVGLVKHALALEENFGVGSHTISVPRLRPALGMDLRDYPHLVTDEEFKRIIIVLRLALPYTGIILSTREKPAFRDILLELGVSQLSAGSCTKVGGYQRDENTAQFKVEDNRSLEEVIQSISRAGYIPSFCTACYRQGRTGELFMDFAKSGKIKTMCQPNALLTWQEYLEDYACVDNKNWGEKAILKEVELLPDLALQREVKNRLERIKNGARDLYF